MIKKFHESRNLFDEVYSNLGYAIHYLPINVGEGQFTASTTTPISGTSDSLWLLEGNVSSGAAGSNNLYIGQSRTVSSVDGYITIAYRITSAAGYADVNPSDYNTMINSGSEALPYEPYGDTWQGKAYSKIVDTTQQVTSFPVVVRPMENTIPSWTIKGNMQQTSTPSPSSIIIPQETGERTGNLLNTTGAQSGYISANGSITQGHDNLMYTDYLPIPDSAEYITQSSTYTMQSPALCFYDATKTYISGEAFSGATTKTFIVPTNAKYIRTSYRSGSSFGNTMLNLGSTPLPYQPYGYKLDIKSGSTTTPVYLGQVQSTRKIVKKVFDGTEYWEEVSSGNLYFAWDIALSPNAAIVGIGICTHLPYNTISASNTNEGFGVQNRVTNTRTSVLIRWNTFSSLSDWTTYLAQQYAAGTPVCVWYVLANETTTTLNEPLRKISTYSDSVSGTNLSVIAQSPTTIDVDTTLKPSEMDLTYTGMKMCGRKRKSANLFDKNQTFGAGYYDDNGELHIQTGENATEHTELIPTNGITTFTIKGLWNYFSGASAFAVYEWDSSGNWLRRSNRTTDVYTNTPITFDIGNDAAYISLQVMPKSSGFTYDNTMLNTGSTALPYAPYWK